MLAGSVAFAQVEQDTTSMQEGIYEYDTATYEEGTEYDESFEDTETGTEQSESYQAGEYENEEDPLQQEESDLMEQDNTGVQDTAVYQGEPYQSGDYEGEAESLEQEVESEYDDTMQEVESDVEEEVNETERDAASEIDQMESGAENATDPMDQQSAAAEERQENMNIQVESDEILNNDFSKYKTYNFSTQVDEELDPGFYFLNDLALKASIREAVKGELEGLGYEREESDPDLVVSFRVFEGPVTLRGFTDEGYGAGYWGGTDLQVREWEDTTSYEVEAGTILLSMLDTELGQVVWQGFASGLLEQDAFNRDEQMVAEAVELLFEEYSYRADKLADQGVDN